MQALTAYGRICGIIDTEKNFKIRNKFQYSNYLWNLKWQKF